MQMPKNDLKYIELLSKALHSPNGVKVKASEPERLRQKLYRVRSKHPEFANVSLFLLSGNVIALINMPESAHAPSQD